jgi:hypothetical protein
MKKKVVILSSLMAFLLVLITACGEERTILSIPNNLDTNVTTNVTSKRINAFNTIMQLENAISASDLETALSLFTEDAFIQVENPLYLQHTPGGNICRLAGGELDPDTSIPFPGIIVNYSGKEQIKQYLSSLINYGFQTQFVEPMPEGSRFSSSDNIGFRNCHLKMAFQPILITGQFHSLTITFFNLT